MTTSTGLSQDGKAKTTKKTFSRETTVSIPIKADSAVIWELLTNAQEYSDWNSTIISLEGDIKEGEKIRLTSTMAPKRVFKLKVKEMIPMKRLVWGDGQGKRVYELRSMNNDTVRFTMTEKIGGPLFPLFAGMIPPFDESFEQFAADLKQAAEKR